LALVAYLVQRLAGTVVTTSSRLAEMTERDGTTGLVKRRGFEELLQHEHDSRAAAATGAYALLMADIDRLAQVNEAWGRDGGDAAVRNVAEAIKRAIRITDVAARYGGDEFMVFLPEAAPQVAEVVAQRIRNAVHQSLFQAGGRLQRVTLSVGVGAFPRDGRSVAEIVATAERRMQQDRALRRRPGEPGPPLPARL
jgi:diguanylate cyclase (GGDEF)-like protein